MFGNTMKAQSNRVVQAFINFCWFVTSLVGEANHLLTRCLSRNIKGSNLSPNKKIIIYKLKESYTSILLGEMKPFRCIQPKKQLMQGSDSTIENNVRNNCFGTK